MTRGPLPENQQRQDQALAYLRDRGIASTGEIAASVWMVPRGHWAPECRRPGRWGGCDRHCPRVWVSSPYGPYPDTAMTRAALIRLQKQGLVERIETPGNAKAWWQAVSTEEVGLDALDAELRDLLA